MREHCKQNDEVPQRNYGEDEHAEQCDRAPSRDRRICEKADTDNDPGTSNTDTEQHGERSNARTAMRSVKGISMRTPCMNRFSGLIRDLPS